jgi:hypothetical protein
MQIAPTADSGIWTVPHHGETSEMSDPHWAGDVNPAETEDEGFVFELGMGSGLDGLNVTTIDASRRASHVWAAGGTPDAWREVHFEVNQRELDELVRSLNDEHVLSLARRYEDKSIADGAQWILHVRTQGRDKYVYASNSFPPPLVRLARFVKEQIIDTRPDLVAKSEPRTFDRAGHLWGWLAHYEGCNPKLGALENGACLPLRCQVRLRADPA